MGGGLSETAEAAASLRIASAGYARQRHTSSRLPFLDPADLVDAVEDMAGVGLPLLGHSSTASVST